MNEGPDFCKQDSQPQYTANLVSWIDDDMLQSLMSEFVDKYVRKRALCGNAVQSTFCLDRPTFLKVALKLFMEQTRPNLRARN